MANRTVPTGTMALALSTLPEGALKQTVVTSSNYVYFDLLEHLVEKLSGDLRSRVLSSMAWMIDMRTLNTARGVFYEAYSECMESGGTESIDGFNAFVTTMNELATRGEHTDEIGFTNTSQFTLLAKLLDMRKYWHDEAYNASSREYNPKTLTTLLLDEKQGEVNIESRKKMKMRAEFAADGDTSLGEQLFERLMAKSQATLQQRFELRQKLNPAILRIIAFAGVKAKIDDTGECPEFHKLDINLQRALIEQTLSTIDRALTDLELATWCSLDDYTVAFKEAVLFKKFISTVLAAPKFAEPDATTEIRQRHERIKSWHDDVGEVSTRFVQPASAPALKPSAKSNGV